MHLSSFYGSLETKGSINQVDVIINGLGDAYDGDI